MKAYALLCRQSSRPRVIDYKWPFLFHKSFVIAQHFNSFYCAQLLLLAIEMTRKVISIIILSLEYSMRKIHRSFSLRVWARVTTFFIILYWYTPTAQHNCTPRLQAKPNQPYFGGCLRRLAINACGAASPYRHKVCLRRLGPLRGLGVWPFFDFTMCWAVCVKKGAMDCDPCVRKCMIGSLLWP